MQPGATGPADTGITNSGYRIDGDKSDTGINRICGQCIQCRITVIPGNSEDDGRKGSGDERLPDQVT